MKKYGFLTLWGLSLLIAPVTVFKVTPLEFAFINVNASLNVLQRLTGILAFTLLFWQIVLGAFMQKWIEKMGAWVFKFHLTEGAIAYALVLAHPLLFVIFNFVTRQGLDPFYVFTDICILCSNRTELFYTFGRVSFWLVTLAIIAAKFRTWSWLRVHWRKFHILNYLAFSLIAIHARFVGTDALTTPFVWFYWITVLVFILIILYKFLNFSRS